MMLGSQAGRHPAQVALNQWMLCGWARVEAERVCYGRSGSCVWSSKCVRLVKLIDGMQFGQGIRLVSKMNLLQPQPHTNKLLLPSILSIAVSPNRAACNQSIVGWLAGYCVWCLNLLLSGAKLHAFALSWSGSLLLVRRLLWLLLLALAEK